jgi:hypothetical protein
LPVAYDIRSATSFEGGWDDPPWAETDIATVGHFHANSTAHRPLTQARLLRSGRQLCVHFAVDDRYVRARHSQYQDPVYKDSCVEFFVRPAPDAGYFNFEINAVGTLLLSYVFDHRRTGKGFAGITWVDAETAGEVTVKTSLSGVIDPEITTPTRWFAKAVIPFSIFDAYLPSPAAVDHGWTGNFYKIASETSHPHWAAWSPIGEELNFHCPEHFGAFRFV